MTAQDKAKELVEKYDQTFTYLESKNKAKQCAIIAVDEILNLDYFSEEGREYWQEIKNEIEKL
jgi:thymidine kinase